jgi:hypothetical protein
MTEKSQGQSKPIEGKVVTVLNERELAINIGAEAGVRDGMRFKVLADEPAELTDPDTGEVLGSYEREKVRVEAIVVQSKYSICRTYAYTLVGGTTAFRIADLFASKPREVYETLRADDANLLPPLSEEESYVKRGDKVVLLPPGS